VSQFYRWYLTSAIVLVVSPWALAQNPSAVLQGKWTATAGSGEAFSGTWTSELSRVQSNAARGSWTLLNGAGEVTLQGTWSARKAGEHWNGTWIARAQPGGSWSGTWTAHVRDLSAKVFDDMLRLTAKGQVTGSLRSGLYHGNWWLIGPGNHPSP
jgi:hypothetical protein